ncbi:MAG: bifunctional hydroxymethylpyrimidine kinase/phosphomethylpyrimidine kinase [Actinomycetota bacterium]|nr:bifunctional hydroxymethylpyrimidine kinase/phosphomethylpyrimidine kinase [Actinomycetota bacterium]
MATGTTELEGRGASPGHGTPPVALTIAGTDSGGGAGIAADLRAFAAHGVFGTLAVTAVTAQDTRSVSASFALDPALVNMQIDAVLGDFPVVAAKTGMLATLAIVEALASRAAEGRLPPLVVDPVMVASSGSALLEGDAVAAYHRLLPHALVATPNLAEAEALLGRGIRTVAAMEEAARELHSLGVAYAVVTGGHLLGDDAVDVAFDGTTVTSLASPMVRTENVHGTGCTFSAAICAGIARGLPPLEAVSRAKRYVVAAIESARDWRLGSGHGPLDHFPPGCPSLPS